ncbi:MAG: patatin-like phospholipase family protein, partial [Caldilineaceae bacterium]|nr:patatin-like phospholipase family protein [Caldilineaceae bacterium]
MEATTTYDIVLEGGGAKGMVFVGALQEFLERGYQTGRLLGTSAGAIAAALMAVDYSAAEIEDALSEEIDGTNVINTFMSTPGGFSPEEIAQSTINTYLREIDIPLVPESMERRLDEFLVNALLMHPNYRHLFSFVERGGWYSADNFMSWMARKLDSGEYNGAPRAFSGATLGELFDATGKHLTVIAGDTTAKQMLVLNHITAPDLPFIWAVRMSMSIPLLWQEVVWQSDWGTYRGQDISGHAV